MWAWFLSLHLEESIALLCYVKKNSSLKEVLVISSVIIQDAMPRMIYMQLNEMCDFTLLLSCSFCTKKPVLKNNNLREVVGNFKVKT